MCNFLKISRSGYYSYNEKQNAIDEYNQAVVDVFNDNQRVYGTRKIKAVLAKQGINLSRRRIARIMRYNGLVSVYTQKRYQPKQSKTNESEIENKLARDFNNRKPKRSNSE